MASCKCGHQHDDEKQKRFEELLAKYKGVKEALIPLLQESQEIFGHLSADTMKRISESQGVPFSKTFGVATFYPQFHLKPQGQDIIRDCQGTACHVTGGAKALDAIKVLTGVNANGKTPDLRFAVETLACIGAHSLFLLNFNRYESCGRCAPCREGTKRLLELLTKVCEGDGEPEDIEKIERLSKVITSTSLCGLGQNMPNPVLSTLNHFRNEYEAYITDKRLPSGVCPNLVYIIDEEKCKGCGLCARICPPGAISGEKKKPHTIDAQKCIKCGTCIQKCKFGSIQALTLS